MSSSGDQDPDCEAGCYRCLLSYYNQPDHELIDRRDEQVLRLLCRLTRADGRNGYRRAGLSRSSSMSSAVYPAARSSTPGSKPFGKGTTGCPIVRSR